jgi:hypothetical protein
VHGLGVSALAAVLNTAATPELPVWSYDVSAGPGARTLRVEAHFAPGSHGALDLARGMAAFVEELEVERLQRWERLAGRGGPPRLPPECESAGCRIRYRFDLARAARESGDLRRALEHEGALLAPPSSWLLRPQDASPGRYRLVVRTPAGVRFVSGVSPAPDADAYEADATSLESAPYSGFGPFTTMSLESGGGRVDVAIAPGERRLSDPALRGWVEQAAAAVSAYYGRLPVPRVLVLLVPGGGRAVGFGTTLAGGGAAVLVFVGRDATVQSVSRDWVLTHELSHLGLPYLSGAPSWIEEGLATYVEPFARARIGSITEAAVWREMTEGLPRGLSGRGEGGLDSAQGYARVYWGGALYWFLCDLELRERTRNARGLQHVLASIVAGGGSLSVSWSLDGAIAELERAAGLPVFRARLQRMGEEPVREDLEALWRRLGIARRGGEVVFDDTAPLGAIRRSLTAPEPIVPGAR